MSATVAESYEAAIAGGYLKYRGDPCSCGYEIRSLATRECLYCFPIGRGLHALPGSRKRRRQAGAERWRAYHATLPTLKRKQSE
jgi:hypothetical protein